jgi:hypothetical protein
VAAKDTREVATLKPLEGGGHRLRDYPFRPYLQGSSVTLDPRGELVHLVSSERGELVVLDAKTLQVKRRQSVCRMPEQVVVAPDGKAFVSCRGDGQVVAVNRDGSVAATRKLRGEPFGLALSPFGDRLVVTTARVPGIVKLATDDLAVSWERSLLAAPRGVAISAEGKRATVAHLTGPWVSVVDVATGQHALAGLPSARDGWPSELFDEPGERVDRRVAGGAFAAAASPGGTRVFVPYVLKNDGAEIDDFIPGCYANGAQLPMAASVAAVDVAQALVRRPVPLPLAPGQEADTVDFLGVENLGLLGVVRAAVHDPVKSRLYAVGEGSSLLASFDTSKADPTIAPLAFIPLSGPAKGVVVDRGGEHAFVHLALSHQLLRVELATQAIETAELVEASKRDTVAQGRELFHTANDQRLSSMTGISCSSCHLEGQSDNVTWRLDGKPLQTPVLAGRSFADAALRWHGDSPNLEHAVKEAITRLGGGGLEDDGLAALVAFLRSGTHEMAVQAQPSATAERGAELFSSAGCDVCHDPGSDYTDGQMHEIGTARFRTPSLRGLARSAPYYHDGSARSLGALLAARHADNPMAVGGRMSLADRLALEAFLKSL